jgi:alpha-methylacyl-CoA racemase
MGPLKGYKVIELAGIGPGPFCATMLSDMGAEVIRVDRKQPSGLGVKTETKYNILSRNRRSIAVDLKSPEGVETVLKLVESADALIEGFRPGVVERLGLGPDVCMARNKKLVFGRMTGWGQDGPWAQAAGHDINYIALSGALHAIGPLDGPPSPPLNLIGDFGGGAMFLGVGVLGAMLEAQKSGEGQIVDTSMVEGAAYLSMMFFGALASGSLIEERGKNILDGGAHFYGVYETSDGKHVSIGSIEPKFYELLMELSGVDRSLLVEQMSRDDWPAMKKVLADVFVTKSRDEWDAIMAETDICYAPVLTFSEAMAHPHNQNRGSFIEVDGVAQPGPAPKFSRTQSEVTRGAPIDGQHTNEILSDWGFDEADIAKLNEAGAVMQA